MLAYLVISKVSGEECPLTAIIVAKTFDERKVLLKNCLDNR